MPRRSKFNFGGRTVTANADSETTTTGGYEWDVAADFAWLKDQKVTVSANLAPIVTDAVVDGNQLTLTFAEDLDEDTTPAASAFTVYIDGGAGANPSSVDSISGKTVTMTLATAVTSGKTVTLDYIRPTTNGLRDESELEAPRFTGRSVTNETGNNAATGEPSISGTAGVGKTLTAAKGTIADDDGTTKADDGDTGFAYAWQWIRVDAADNESEISPARPRKPTRSPPPTWTTRSRWKPPSRTTSATPSRARAPRTRRAVPSCPRSRSTAPA